MPDEDFEDEEQDEPDLEGDLDSEMGDDEFGTPSLDEDDLLDDDDDDDIDDIDDIDEDLDTDTVVAAGDGEEAAAKEGDGDEDEDDETLDLEEELHPDDVEEPLDVLLLERTSSGLLDEEEYDEEEEDESDERAEPGSRIPPKRPGEFVCRSCFLVKHPSQLADNDRVLCTDCV
jgi:hypothetical protein